MNTAALSIYSNVGFHSKIPLLPLFGLMHLWITALAFVLGRAGGIDDRGIYNGSLLEEYSLRFQMAGYLIEELFANFVLLQQSPKIEGGRLIRYRACQREPCKGRMD